MFLFIIFNYLNLFNFYHSVFQDFHQKNHSSTFCKLDQKYLNYDYHPVCFFILIINSIFIALLYFFSLDLINKFILHFWFAGQKYFHYINFLLLITLLICFNQILTFLNVTKFDHYHHKLN